MKQLNSARHIISALALCASPTVFSEATVFQCLVTGSTTLETVQGNGRQLAGIQGSFRKGDFIDFSLSQMEDSKTLQLEIRFKEIPEYFFDSVKFKLDSSEIEDVENKASSEFNGPTALIASGEQGFLSLNQYHRQDWHGLIMTRESWTDSETGLMATVNCFDAGVMITNFSETMSKASP
jgi:hypothetical protein